VKEKYFAIFKKSCVKDSMVLFSIFISNYTIQCFGTFKLTFLSSIVSTIVYYPFIAVFGFISFIKNFENFIIASMKDFKREIKDFSKCKSVTDSFKLKQFYQLSNKYQKIANLLKEFNKCFGLQVTILSCYLTALLVFNASLRKEFEHR
jgi:hypothetical protein